MILILITLFSLPTKALFQRSKAHPFIRIIEGTHMANHGKTLKLIVNARILLARKAFSLIFSVFVQSPSPVPVFVQSPRPVPKYWEYL